VCALGLIIVIGIHRRLHVAVTGDSRAVMGVWEQSSGKAREGKWRVQVLTEDQTGRNEKEAERLVVLISNLSPKKTPAEFCLHVTC
jgi:pyruvate dehydrogenase phosphatase